MNRMAIEIWDMSIQRTCLYINTELHSIRNSVDQLREECNDLRRKRDWNFNGSMLAFRGLNHSTTSTVVATKLIHCQGQSTHWAFGFSVHPRP